MHGGSSPKASWSLPDHSWSQQGDNALSSQGEVWREKASRRTVAVTCIVLVRGYLLPLLFAQESGSLST